VYFIIGPLLEMDKVYIKTDLKGDIHSYQALSSDTVLLKVTLSKL